MYGMNWRKFTKITLLILVGIPLLVKLASLAYKKYRSIPRKTTEYWGIKLGDSYKDVRFLKSEPTIHLVKFTNKEGTRQVPLKEVNKALDWEGYAICKPTINNDAFNPVELGAIPVIPNECF